MSVVVGGRLGPCVPCALREGEQAREHVALHLFVVAAEGLGEDLCLQTLDKVAADRLKQVSVHHLARTGPVESGFLLMANIDVVKIEHVGAAEDHGERVLRQLLRFLLADFPAVAERFHLGQHGGNLFPSGGLEAVVGYTGAELAEEARMLLVGVHAFGHFVSAQVKPGLLDARVLIHLVDLADHFVHEMERRGEVDGDDVVFVGLGGVDVGLVALEVGEQILIGKGGVVVEVVVESCFHALDGGATMSGDVYLGDDIYIMLARVHKDVDEILSCEVSVGGIGGVLVIPSSAVVGQQTVALVGGVAALRANLCQFGDTRNLESPRFVVHQVQVQNIQPVGAHLVDESEDIFFLREVARNIEHKPAIGIVGPVLDVAVGQSGFAESCQRLACVVTSGFVGGLNLDATVTDVDAVPLCGQLQCGADGASHAPFHHFRARKEEDGFAHAVISGEVLELVVQQLAVGVSIPVLDASAPLFGVGELVVGDRHCDRFAHAVFDNQERAFGSGSFFEDSAVKAYVECQTLPDTKSGKGLRRCDFVRRSGDAFEVQRVALFVLRINRDLAVVHSPTRHWQRRCAVVGESPACETNAGFYVVLDHLPVDANVWCSLQ